MIRVNNLTDAWEAYKVRRVPRKKAMRKVTLTRYETGPEGTYSNVITDSGYAVYGMELPWKGNKANESCIPDGTYECAIVQSPKFGKVYEIKNVPDRTNVLAHPANWIRQLLGCLALGRAVGLVLGIKGLMSSKDAIEGFMADLDGEPFTLTVKWAEGIKP